MVAVPLQSSVTEAEPGRLAVYRGESCPVCGGDRGIACVVDSIVHGSGHDVWDPCTFCVHHATWELRTVLHEGRWWVLACPEIDGAPALAGAVLGVAATERDALRWALLDEWPLDRFDVQDRRVMTAMELAL